VSLPTPRKIEPPMQWRGAGVDAIWTRVLDNNQCQSCGYMIKDGDQWGVIAEIFDPGDRPVLQCLRLCRECWMIPAKSMGRLTKGWER
jgi:hypothetical protein